MKKIVLSIVALCLIFMIRCNRKNFEKNDATQSVGGGLYRTLKDSLSIGENHNLILERYWNVSGDTVLGIGLDTGYAQDMLETFFSFMAEDSVISWSMVDTLVNTEMNFYNTTGFFRGDSLKTQHEIDSICIASITNVAIKATFMNVLNYQGDMTNFIAYTTAEFAKLSGLTSAEQEAIDGVVDVIGSSYSLFSAKELLSEAGRHAVMVADGLGAYNASLRAPIIFPNDPGARVVYVYICSSAASGIAARNILNH